MPIKLKLKPSIVQGNDSKRVSEEKEKEQNRKELSGKTADSLPLLQEMEKMFKQRKPQVKEKKDGENFLEFRDRSVATISSFDQANNDEEYIEEWIGDVCRKVMSTGFHHFIEENMTFDQAKIYCCQQILRNISEHTDKFQVDSNFFKITDRIIKEKIMPYLALKYPLNNSQNSNKALSKVIKEINNMEMLSNDFFYNSDIVLKYRENGNYNDIIMRVINDMVSLADQPCAINMNASSSDIQDDFEEVTNFKDFDNYMTKFFDKVYDPVWMKEKSRSNLKSSINFEEQKTKQFNQEQYQKYKQKVQEYTQYQIGRKIPESISAFTSQQIRSGHLVIKSPQILRIMTKWCEELWNKFDNQNYYIDKTEGVAMLNSKHINILYQWIRISLKKLLKEEKNKILKYMQNVENNLYQQTFRILQSELMSKQSPFLNRYQRVCGKFSVKLVNNLKNCVILYLNRLIHGLMNVSDILHRTKMSGMPSWPSPPNLLSFKIGDLLRCRIASREKQIVRLYQQLMNISQSNPQKLKVIRVKNRLQSGTNDLLLNIRYNNQLTSQIQLKVLSKLSQSRFESCSFKYAHFIYQLQRAQFGPISQMCSIWFSHDKRTKIYQQLVLKQNLNKNKKGIIYLCELANKKHQFQSIQNEPFICSKCGKSYSSDNYVLTHKKCKLCNYYQCCFCQIDNEDNNHELMQELVADQSVRDNLNYQKCDVIPKLGVCIKIQNNTQGEMNMFKSIQTRQKLFLFFVRTDGSFQLKHQLKTDKERKKFLKDHIIFQYTGEEPETFQALTLKQALQSYIQPLYIKNCYKLEKESLSLNQIGGISFDPQKIRRLLRDPRQSKKAIKQLQISSQNLVDLNFIPSEFINLQLINVNINNLVDIQALSKFKKLKTLYCSHNKLTQYPVSLCKLPLRVLSIGQNSLQQLPPQFEQHRHLQIVRLDGNNFQYFPDVLTNLANLREILLNKNGLKEIPPQISKLTRLRHLKLSHNKLSQLPQQMKSLTLLQSLDVSSNELTEIKIEFKKMKRLKEMDLSKNKLQTVPVSLSQCRDLTKLELHHNCLQKLDFTDIVLPHVSDLNLQHCKIKEIIGISNIKNVSTLKLSSNQIEELPEDICHLKLLKYLDVQKNKIEALPSNIHQLFNLQNLNISSNQKITLPPSFSKLKLLTLKINRCSLPTFPYVITKLKLLKVLDISVNLIKVVPQSIRQLKSLQILMLGSNNISNFPKQMVELKNLKRMTFKQRGFFSINDIMSLFVRLQAPSIDMSKSNIDVFPERMATNSEVESIILHSNYLQYIPIAFSRFTSLRTLDISINRLTAVNDAIFELKELTSLNISHNLIKSLPNKFNKLSNLSALDISCNKIDQVPDSLKSIFRKDFKFNYLGNKINRLPLWMSNKEFTSSSIQLSGQFLDKLPKRVSASALRFSTTNLQKDIKEEQENKQSEEKDENIEKAEKDKGKLIQFPRQVLTFTKLEELNLQNNQIKQIPQEIKKLTNLKYLYISNNCIEQIPKQLCESGICRLEIDDNPLKKIPQQFAKLDKLHLRISPSVFEVLKENQCLQFLKARAMILSDMKLEQLPPQLQEITSIRHLDLSANMMKSVPECVFNLKNLNILNLSDQPLQTLPDAIQQLQYLNELMITNCQLTEIPASLGKLSKLLRLYLSNNRIKQLPPQLSNLKNLLRFDMNNNELQNFPQFLLQTKKCIKIYLNDNRIESIPELLQDHPVKQLGLSNNKIERVSSMFVMMKLKQQALFLNGNPVKYIQDYEAIKSKLSKASAKQLQKIVNQK